MPLKWAGASHYNTIHLYHYLINHLNPINQMNININKIQLAILCLMIAGLSLLFTACNKEGTIGEAVSDLYHLEHEGADMPIVVEGNTASKVFILILHGGPGGNAKIYNDVVLRMSEPLEADYAVAYWDQRSSGNSKGRFSPNKLNLEQMIEDTDMVVELLKDQYGDDISLFLLGHSWGGYLGNAYLATGNNQEKIAGWIDVDGVHDFELMMRAGDALMNEIATQQINEGSNQRVLWQEIKDFTDETEVNGISLQQFSEINRYAYVAEGLATTDGLIEIANFEASELFQLLWHSAFGSHNPITEATNSVMIQGTGNLMNQIINRPLGEEMGKITIPSLFLWGQYDFVVPPAVGQDALEKIGTPGHQKSLAIFGSSGHSPMLNQPDPFMELLIKFIELYK